METASVSKAAMALCPLEVVLERVTVTANGNVIACWQIVGGADPSEVRRWGLACICCLRFPHMHAHLPLLPYRM